MCAPGAPSKPVAANERRQLAARWRRQSGAQTVTIQNARWCLCVHLLPNFEACPFENCLPRCSYCVIQIDMILAGVVFGLRRTSRSLFFDRSKWISRWPPLAEENSGPR